MPSGTNLTHLGRDLNFHEPPHGWGVAEVVLDTGQWVKSKGL